MKALYLCGLCLVAMAVGCGGGSSPAGPPAELPGPGTQRDNSRRIVIDSERYGTADIFTMAPDGSDWVRLTVTPEREWMPRWSPDRTMIAYFRGMPDDYRNMELWIMRADGTDQRKIRTTLAADNLPFTLTWSPDAKHIAYKRVDILEIFEVSNPVMDIESLTNVLYATWSPSANWGSSEAMLLVKRHFVNSKSSESIALIGGATTQRIVEHTMVREGGIYYHTTEGDIDWSPDGNTFLFRRSAGPTTTGIYATNRDGTGLRQVSTGLDDAPRWSPDSQELIFTRRASEKNNDVDIYAVHRDGSALRLVIGADAKIRNLDW